VTQAILQNALSRGVSAGDMPAIVENNRMAARGYQKLGEQIAAAQVELGNLDAGMSAKVSEVEDVVNRIGEALNLTATNEDGIEPTADLLAIVRAMVESVIVKPDRTVKIELASDGTAWRRVFAAVAGAALDSHRLETAITSGRRAGRQQAAE
jgi:hypothetical protein